MAVGKVVAGIPYQTRHNHVYRQRGPAKNHKCEHCGKSAFDWAQIADTDGISADDYMPLCRKCHQQYDNVHGRPTSCGEGHPNSKLTTAQVCRIIALDFCEDITRSYLAESFGVTRRAISNILEGRGRKDGDYE